MLPTESVYQHTKYRHIKCCLLYYMRICYHSQLHNCGKSKKSGGRECWIVRVNIFLLVFYLPWLVWAVGLSATVFLMLESLYQIIRCDILVIISIFIFWLFYRNRDKMTSLAQKCTLGFSSSILCRNKIYFTRLLLQEMVSSLPGISYTFYKM